MLQQLSAIVAAISDSLPTTILTEKLKAISQSPIINGLRDHYRKKHDLDNATRKDIFISDLLSDIDTDILPHIQKKDSDDKIEGTKRNTTCNTVTRKEQLHCFRTSWTRKILESYFRVSKKYSKL